jgi:ribonuclease J
MTSKKLLTRDFKMKPDAVYFVALGGCGMFGANMALYGHQGKWIMVDCGMGFADDTMPGVDILLPDPSFAAELGEDLLAVIITHGHEDHIGGLQHLWPRFKAPLYATPFTAERIRQHFNETPWGGQTKMYEIPPRGRIDLGPFQIDTIKMAHSIPEMRALSITVKGVGTLLHTGDFKFDPAPMEGDVCDEEALKKLGDAGVLAMMGDSTNSIVPGHSGSEADVKKNMTELLGEFKTGLIVVSCFSTNVARLRSVYEAAYANNRQVCIVGRSMWQVDEAARKSGYLKGIPPFLDSDLADLVPVDNLVYICTGSQGEPRAVLNRVSNDDHPDVRVADGDVVIFSSRAIPGNERAIERMKNRFMIMGVNVITDHDAPIHVSGHPYRDELKKMYSLVRPKFAVPVHGEHMQQEKHADLARECGVEDAVIPVNGNVFEITQESIRHIGNVKSGILAIEGKRIVAVDHEAILTRKRMIFNGSAVVTVVVDRAGHLVAPPKITALGLLDENSEKDNHYFDGAIAEIEKKIKSLPKTTRENDDELSEAVRIAARRYFNEHFDRKPQTRVHLVRV